MKTPLASRAPRSSRRTGAWLRRSALPLVAVGALSFALAACGGSPAAAKSSSTSSTSSASASSGSSTGKSSGSKASSSVSADFSKYTACLKSHGVSVPSFGQGGSFHRSTTGSKAPKAPSSGTKAPASPAAGKPTFATNSKFTAAEKACASLRPKGAVGGFGGFNGSTDSAATAAYRNCLKLHGVTLTRPTGSTTSGGSAGTASSSKLATALKACASLRPKAGSGSTTTTSTAS